MYSMIHKTSQRTTSHSKNIVHYPTHIGFNFRINLSDILDHIGRENGAVAPAGTINGSCDIDKEETTEQVTSRSVFEALDDDQQNNSEMEVDMVVLTRFEKR